MDHGTLLPHSLYWTKFEWSSFTHCKEKVGGPQNSKTGPAIAEGLRNALCQYRVPTNLENLELSGNFVNLEKSGNLRYGRGIFYDMSHRL